MSGILDLSTVPAPAVIETLDYEGILAAMLADLRARHPNFSALVESDPAYKILQVAAYRELLLRARINDAAKSVMLAYATGADLEHLAALFSVARKPGEADADLRKRVQLALDGLATAGSAKSYLFHALSVGGVRDASVSSPSPGIVRVAVLGSPENGIPNATTLAGVTAALNAEEVRPLTDTVEVVPATVLTYTVAATVRPFAGPDPAVILANANAAVAKYVADNFRLGRDITLSGLYAALHQPGVERVDLQQPAANLTVALDAAARCTGITLTDGGVLV